MSRRFSWGSIPSLGCVLVCTVALGCHSGGGGHSSSKSVFQCTDSASAKDVVVLLCGQRTQADVWLINMVIGGPTTSTDISGFNFDVVFDPTDLSYVSGSAALGTLLTQGGSQPLLAADLASNDPGRLIVGVHRTNPSTGVQGTATQNLILQFSMRANLLSNFGPVPLQFQNAEAVDSSGAAIGSVTFSDQVLLSVQ